MGPTVNTIIICGSLLFAMLAMAYGCHRYARQRTTTATSAKESVATTTGAMFALLGLLMAFSFSGAYSRFDDRRQIIVAEVNAISTAYLRLDLLPAESQGPIRIQFNDYVRARAGFLALLNNEQEARAELARQEGLQRELWRQVIKATEDLPNPSTRSLLLPALNDMFDIAETRTVAIQTHPPLLIFFMLFTLSLMCAGFVGFGAKGNQHLSHIHVVGFAAVIAITIYVILDIEYPRFGFVRLDLVNQELLRLAEQLE